MTPHTLRLEEVERKKFVGEDLPRESYQWTLELAEQRSSHLPRLKEVVLWETTSERYSIFSSAEWDTPLVVDHAFDHRGINLEVRVRELKIK